MHAHGLVRADQILSVCKYAATTKEEWEEQCKIWPTSFHPPTYNIDGITGFNEENSKGVLKYINFAIELAKSAGSQFVNAAVIVDPSLNQIITSACDEIFSWNMRLDGNEAHLLDADEAATSHDVVNRSSLLKFNLNDLPNDHNTSCSTISCLNPWQWSQQHLSSSRSCFWHPLRHAAMVAIDNAAVRDRRMFPVTGEDNEKSVQFDTNVVSAVGFPAKRQKTYVNDVKNGDDVSTNVFLSRSEKPYLCTGYDIYLAWEPCAMCAMALVHQRIRRIFFAFSNPNNGALGSVYRLQGEKSLNHHYAVFQVILHDESLASVEESKPVR